jgi:hypothetical protein
MRVHSRTWLAVVVHPDNIVVQVGRNGRLVLEASVAVDMLPAGLVDTVESVVELVGIVEAVVELVDIVVSAVEPFEVVDRLVAAVEGQVQSSAFVEGHNNLEDIPMWEGNIDTPV